MKSPLMEEGLTRDDWLAFLLGFGVSLGIYIWSAAPNVTLLDSGEFIVAAGFFGVPHPTGYPLWTLLAWVFQLLPLGNLAWEINLFSGVCGAMAVGLCGALICNQLRWVLGCCGGGVGRRVPLLVAVPVSLAFALSVSMWSQAVIAEVYTLHALLVVLYLIALAGWVRRPSSDRRMLAAFFLLALGFSNHHLMLVLAPLPFLLILLLRTRAFLDWLFAASLAGLMIYLGFAILSEDGSVLKAGLRLSYVVFAGGLLFILLRKGRVRWRLVAYLPLVLCAGLLPYVYLPVASGTNPPMNWSYAREREGFFYAINRSQYSGSLSEQTLRLLRPIVGVGVGGAVSEEHHAPRERGRTGLARDWVGFFWIQVSRAFSPVGILGYFSSILLVLRRGLAMRTWVYLLHFGFVLAAFLQPLLDGARVDNAGWALQMPYHGYTNLIFAILSALGLGMLLELVLVRGKLSCAACLVGLQFLPVWTWVGSEGVANQRERWFGWMFGRDMLKDLPKGAIVFGGTDPGRFVPTYMIFGESRQPVRFKRDGGFDRRDLYIMTQNALGERFYMKYIRDHYGKARPEPDGLLARLLGREGMYPEKALELPSEEEVDEIVRSLLREGDDGLVRGKRGSGVEGEIFGKMLRWIWERNKDEHEFYVEESFQIEWVYDYALPEGLIFKLEKERVEEIPREVVEKDFRFWAGYKEMLLGNPRFRDDYDARRSFSKLRVSQGNLYRHRGLGREAEMAYREALELSASNMEAILPLLEIFWGQGRFGEAMRVLEGAYADDPNNSQLVELARISEQREKFHGEVVELREKLRANPTDQAVLERLLAVYATVGMTNEARPVVEGAIKDFSTNAKVLLTLASFSEASGFLDSELEALRALVKLRGEDARARYLLGRVYLKNRDEGRAVVELKKAIELGGGQWLETLRADPVVREWRNSLRIRKLMEEFHSN